MAATLSFALLLGNPPAAQAVPSQSVTPTTTTYVAANASTTLTGMAVSGFAPDDDVQVTISTDRGTLTVPQTTGLKPAYGNSFTDEQSITFTGLSADVNPGLASVTLASGDAAGQKAKVSITALPTEPGFVYSPFNGHFYRYVLDPDVDWGTARLAAKASTFLGQAGYLATMPSAQINSLVASRIEGAQDVWFGARAMENYSAPVKRAWQWADGPLAGDPISYCSNIEGECDFVTPTTLDSLWADGEPNNYGVETDIESNDYLPNSGEWVAVTNWHDGSGEWNDLPASPPFDSASGYVVEYGDQEDGSTGFQGVVSASSDVTIAGPPNAPTDVTAVRGNGSATVSFTPGAAHGAPAYNYIVSASPGGQIGSCPASPCEVAGLTNGTTYTFTVKAESAGGLSAASSPSAPLQLGSAPGKPTDVVATAGNKEASVTFTPPADDGGLAITDYYVTPGPGGSPQPCAASPCVVKGLTNGTAYTFTVQAENGVGVGQASDPSSAVTPLWVPGAPTGVSAVRGNGEATITFTAPTDTGGSEITGYTVISSADELSRPCPSSPCTITGLTNGSSYTFRVSARNAQGDSVASEASNEVIPATKPGAPTGVKATGNDKSATVSFTAPVSTGGSPITKYIATSTAGNRTGSCSESPCLVEGLNNGDSYMFTVRAINAVGDSPESEQSEAVTPMTVPDAPTNVVASRGNASVSLKFDAPAGNGGSPITGYVAKSAPGGHTSEDCSLSNCVVEGLHNGTEYVFTITAMNQVGSSEASAESGEVTPGAAPGAPVNLEVKRASGAAELSFIAPDEDGGYDITGYDVSTDGGETWGNLDTLGSTHITATVNGLSNGTKYDIWVRARNEIGVSEPAQHDPVTPATKPDAPTGVTATRGNGLAKVAFTPGAANGSPIINYTVSSSPVTSPTTCTGSPCEVKGLTNGTSYTFTVVANNELGHSPSSEESNEVTPASPPSAPTQLTAKSLAGAVQLSFNKPVSVGGAQIDGYEVSTDGGLHWAPLTHSAGDPMLATLTGLTNGKAYKVMVRAASSAGKGTPSATITVTPATVPGAPTKVTAAGAPGKVTVTWSRPASNGGSAITHYVVTAKPGKQTCTTKTTSCVFAHLVVGETYSFSVVAVNTVDDKSGTGTGPGAVSNAVRVTDRAGAPRSLVVKPGDRVLRLSFQRPVSDGASKITAYQVSLDRGKSWRRLSVSGTTTLSAAIAPVLNGRSYTVAVRAVNANGAGPSTPVVAVKTAAWFADPVSKANRAREINVPANPTRYRGPLRRTKANYRSKNGTIAYPAAALKKRQLQSGQAVNLGGASLFRFNRGALTEQGRAQVKSMAASLTYVSTITCEGYADYGGQAKHEMTLSRQRAKTVCDAIKRYAKQVTTRSVKGYGRTYPVLVGGRVSDRSENRRVVVLIRG